MSWDDDLAPLVGKKITAVFMNENFLKFETVEGNFCFTVEGDCCSRSYFHDFIGIDKLLKNGPVLSATFLDMDEVQSYDYDVIRAYGLEIVTEDPRFGEVTSVLAYRNRSNGYYGGWMEPINSVPDDVPQVFDDVVLGDDE